ncbi:putative outer membrane protein TOM13 [Lyophyllum shimeji]|uniref:Outer membrane protein TOM13 n=1 Tax=Lyophyllum shimeji TaxID=47721 RepID=A0A9P3PQH8_LYOSH|nr:putative outer membrane protein TOM13 [Lyophyllum shimeji]
MALEGDHGAEDILQAALSHAFSPPPSRRHSVQVTSVPTDGSLNEPTRTSEEPHPEPSISSGSMDDSWKAEYESQVEAWRAQSAEAREKAEKERERWEALRAAEREDVARHKADEPAMEPTEHEPDAGWETVSHKNDHPATSTAGSEEAPSPSPADVRDLVTGEINCQSTAPTTASTTSQPPAGIPETHLQTQTDNGDESQKWEDIQSSVTSSFPSMSYPERTETPSPSRQPATPPPGPQSATLAVFDSTLSTRTRVLALFSSLAINLLLPFVNGVMLGFGEIFAKNVVMNWFGWKPARPGHVASAAGVGAGAGTRTPWGQRHKQKQS